ncbi:MAG: hypothetical protein ACMG6E_07840, partial [Candidatus Roizmanbacteria bacterium]
RIYNNKTGSYQDPTFDGFTPIIVMTISTAYGSLNPFYLKDEEGRIHENVWQAGKVYPDVPDTICRFSRYDSRVIWKWKAEVHAEKLPDGSWKVKKQYLKWRRQLMNCKDAVRYPVGFNHRHKCLFALAEGLDGKIIPKPLDYVASRKAIYLPLYVKLVKPQKQFKELKQRLAKGEKLLIIEVDGPHQESMPYYKEQYNVADDFIEGNTCLATEENLQLMLNDPKHPFGHGYCLAAALQDMQLI